MRLRLLAFASASDAVGGSEAAIELPAGASVGELRRELAARFPALSPLLARLAIAVDGEVAGDDRALSDGLEIALLPPVSGG